MTPVGVYFHPTMVVRATVPSHQMREFIGPKAPLGDSFIALEVHCANVAMTHLVRNTNAQAKERRTTGFVNHALLLQLAMRMFGVME